MPDNNAPPTLPDPQTAYQTLVSEVRSRAMFSKLASDYGIAPRTEHEAASMLELAVKLAAVNQETGQTKAANANNPYAQALVALDRTLASHGLGKQGNDLAIRNAALQIAGDQRIYNSVLSLKSAEAVEIGTRLGLNMQAAPATPATPAAVVA